jgi:nucleoside-triphosphatase
MNNFFLTGKKRVGKTTILKSVFRTANIVPGGYTTFKLLDFQSGRPLLFQLKKAKFLLEDEKLVKKVKQPESMKRADLPADCRGLFKKFYSSNFRKTISLQLNKHCIFAERLNAEEKFNVYPEVFDNCGVKLLNSSKNIILIDELGRFELDAEKFKEKIFALLESDILLIGVIKAEYNKFLDKIRAREDIEIFETTKTNRNKIYDSLLDIVKNNV